MDFDIKSQKAKIQYADTTQTDKIMELLTSIDSKLTAIMEVQEVTENLRRTNADRKAE